MVLLRRRRTRACSISRATIGSLRSSEFFLAQNADDPNPEPSPNRGATGTQTQTSPLRQLRETWDSLRTQLGDRGVQFSIRYDGEDFANISGGLRRGGTYLGNLNLQLTLDAQRLIGWPGATVFLYGLGIHGGHPSNFVGDAQGVSNIEAPAKWKIEEGWVQQNLFGNRFSALFGRYDLNSEFYRLQSARRFQKKNERYWARTFSQSGKNGPSIFPFTSVGGRFAVKPIEGIALRTAVLDGVPVERPNGSRQVLAKGDGALIVTEAAYLYRPVGSEQPRTRQFRIGRNCCRHLYRQAGVRRLVLHGNFRRLDKSRARWLASASSWQRQPLHTRRLDGLSRWE